MPSLMCLRRLVLNTNVLVSALLFPAGAASWLREIWQSQTHRAAGKSEYDSGVGPGAFLPQVPANR